jgi:hypothetical protein
MLNRILAEKATPFLQVNGVADVFAALKNKTADFALEVTDSALYWYFDQNFTAQIFAGGSLGSEMGLAVSRANNVTGYVDVAGRSYLVDSPASGLTFNLWKITELQGINSEAASFLAVSLLPFHPESSFTLVNAGPLLCYLPGRSASFWCRFR